MKISESRELIAAVALNLLEAVSESSQPATRRVPLRRFERYRRRRRHRLPPGSIVADGPQAGKPLSEVPDAYFRWVYHRRRLYPPAVRATVEAEYKRREELDREQVTDSLIQAFRAEAER